ncbi:UvrD-helicase domain-containing protein [Paenibacillus sp. JCM 10914]|uniref:HelD family protein n=1 Tax=Paenibacillus sp. JCM 10914 TaxID=1236974 RepID=UPI0003CC5089|nr:UvrD-helicase domain-containing protein [Paenibacillus sp. JCM 10914]GAE04012.1 UvrD/Rep helicase family protein [Paenibacillus sp. JCM 10914]
MSESFQSAYQEEESRLNEVIVEIDRQLERLRGIPVYTGHDFTEQVLEAGREEKRQALAKSLPEPYFGRLDFQENGSGDAKPLYIGKMGFDKEVAGDHPMVIDWRAPVASLFYSFTGGTDPASFEAPEGIIEGLVYLKRNVVIRKQILERVSDTYNRDGDGLAVSDEFLVYRLGENKDNRLRDIVSTIQAEQDQIIRAAKNTALIIQGVAGSGKTTVALHRLAYLLYQYKEQVTAEKMIIFAPNLMFLDYISDVLPELGVGDIQQRTFGDWACDLLDIEISREDHTQTLARWFETEPGRGTPDIDDQVSGRYKGSLKLKELVQRFVVSLEESALPEEDFSPWEGAVLDYKTISEWFHQEYKPYPLAKRKERLLARLHRWVEMELKKSPSTAVLKERKKKAAQREKAYANRWLKFEPIALYKQLFGVTKSTGSWIETLSEAIPAGVLADTRKDLKKNVVREEDLPALLYFHCLLNDITGEQRFDHIVIDEAQDFSPFQVSVLDMFVRGHSFTILGDLSQGIHAYRGVHAWEEISSLFQKDETAYFALTRSYRSTMEIIEFANGVLDQGVHSELLAVPVFRSGDAVRLIPYADTGTRVKDLQRALSTLIAKEYRTAAILTRTLREAVELHDQLQKQWPELHLIDGSKGTYQGGYSVLPVYLSKGLEFDTVVVADADTEHYAEKAWDAKLLYVGCTRALHELWLLHGALVPSYVSSKPSEITAIGWPEANG